MPDVTPGSASPERRERSEILVIGDVMLDIIAAPQRDIAHGTDTPSRITLLPGGSGANLAAWLARFGNAVAFIGRVGHADADFHATALRAHGVEPLLAIDDRERTGVLVTLIGTDAERTFLTDRGANARLGRGDLPDARLARVRHIHVSGYAFFDALPRAAIGDFLATATRRGVPFSVDCGSAGFLRDVGAAGFFGWTHGATLCFANADEAALMAGHDDIDEQLRRLAAHYPAIVVTGGAAGARAARNGGNERAVAAAPAVAARDSTGAGDAFVAGFLTAHLRGKDLQTCLTRGVEAGSTAVQHVGGRPKGRFGRDDV